MSGPCIVLTPDEADAFRVGWREGRGQGRDGVRVPPDAYFAWPAWRRHGWVLGTDDGAEGRDAAAAGQRARTLGLPLDANPCEAPLEAAAWAEGWESTPAADIRWQGGGSEDRP